MTARKKAKRKAKRATKKAPTRRKPGPKTEVNLSGYNPILPLEQMPGETARVVVENIREEETKKGKKTIENFYLDCVLLSNHKIAPARATKKRGKRTAHNPTTFGAGELVTIRGSKALEPMKAHAEAEGFGEWEYRITFKSKDKIGGGQMFKRFTVKAVKR